jgi:hypothetical protein
MYNYINQIKMDSKVLVTADKAGNVIIKSASNTEYGHIRVEQTRMVIDENGFARRKKLSALIPGTIGDLKAFSWSVGEQVDGKVIVKESLKPFNKRDPERDYKIAGLSGIVCCKDNQPIYRKHFYTLSSTAEDTAIEHTNSEEIQAAYAAVKEGQDVSSSEDFNL